MSSAQRLKRLSRWLAENFPSQAPAVTQAVKGSLDDGNERLLVAGTGSARPTLMKTGTRGAVPLETFALHDAIERAAGPDNRRRVLNFHTHPEDSVGLGAVVPSDADLNVWSQLPGEWPGRFRSGKPYDLTFSIATPPRNYERHGYDKFVPTPFMAFRTDSDLMQKRRMMVPVRHDNARAEIALAAHRGKLDPLRKRLEAVSGLARGDSLLYDLIDSSDKHTVFRYFADKGEGTFDYSLGGNRLMPFAEDQELFDMLYPYARQVLEDKKFKHGGRV
jgi:hypothetical protein